MSYNREYYVFEDETTALAAESYICSVAKWPNPNTLYWDVPWQRVDGKWVFQRIHKYLRDNVPQENKDYFNSNFPHTVENFEKSWVSEA